MFVTGEAIIAPRLRNIIPPFRSFFLSHPQGPAMRLLTRFASVSVCALNCLLLSGSGTFAQQDTQSDSATVSDQDAKPHVLILGDSISIGYTPVVQDLLKDEANVVRPTNKNGGAENCAGTNNGVKNIDRWLELDGGKWDVIHFNFGLHDLKHVQPETGANSDDPNHPHQASPAKYEEQLRAITEKLKATGATLIYATTTPVPEGGVRPYRAPADVEKFNAIAVKIMQENDIEVNDLFAFAEPKLAEIQRPVNVHFSKEGSQALGEEVVKHIRAALKPE